MTDRRRLAMEFRPLPPISGGMGALRFDKLGAIIGVVSYYSG